MRRLRLIGGRGAEDSTCHKSCVNRGRKNQSKSEIDCFLLGIIKYYPENTLARTKYLPGGDNFLFQVQLRFKCGAVTSFHFIAPHTAMQ